MSKKQDPILVAFHSLQSDVAKIEMAKKEIGRIKIEIIDPNADVSKDVKRRIEEQTGILGSIKNGLKSVGNLVGLVSDEEMASHMARMELLAQQHKASSSEVKTHSDAIHHYETLVGTMTAKLESDMKLFVAALSNPKAAKLVGLTSVDASKEYATFVAKQAKELSVVEKDLRSMQKQVFNLMRVPVAKRMGNEFANAMENIGRSIAFVAAKIAKFFVNIVLWCAKKLKVKDTTIKSIENAKNAVDKFAETKWSNKQSASQRLTSNLVKGMRKLETRKDAILNPDKSIQDLFSKVGKIITLDTKGLAKDAESHRSAVETKANKIALERKAKKASHTDTAKVRKKEAATAKKVNNSL